MNLKWEDQDFSKAPPPIPTLFVLLICLFICFRFVFRLIHSMHGNVVINIILFMAYEKNIKEFFLLLIIKIY